MANKIKQPTNVVIKGNDEIEMVLKFEKGLAQGFNRAIDVTENEIIKTVSGGIDNYIPLRTGKLIESKKEVLVDGSPTLQWDAGYGVYVYNRKISNTTLNGKRGPQWYDRYIADYREFVLQKSMDAYAEELKKL